jgi:hypothetical protein
LEKSKIRFDFHGGVVDGGENRSHHENMHKMQGRKAPAAIQETKPKGFWLFCNLQRMLQNLRSKKEGFKRAFHPEP